MKENMTVKELKEFFDKFPDDAIVCTDTNNHYSTEGIRYATLVECGRGIKRKFLFIGNTKHDGSTIYNYTYPLYNLANLEIIKTISIFDK